MDENGTGEQQQPEKPAEQPAENREDRMNTLLARMDELLKRGEEVERKVTEFYETNHREPGFGRKALTEQLANARERELFSRLIWEFEQIGWNVHQQQEAESGEVKPVGIKAASSRYRV